jgi:hypothetical protein
MIAEIHHKISQSGSNLSEKLEDELTGNYFGNFRYIPFNRGLKQVFVNHVVSESNIIKHEIQNIDANEWNVEFWRKSDLGLGEIDACIEFDDAIIGIEVKLFSGLSSDDQLVRESYMLKEWGRSKKKILLFIADEYVCKPVYENNINKINKAVLFGYMSWQKALEGLQLVITKNSFEELIISDLKRLMEEKGFEHFSGFSFVSNEIEDSHWQFSVRVENKFNFLTSIIVEGDEKYEFW